MKRCPRCELDQPLETWPKKKNRLGPYCRPCQQQYDRDWWAKKNRSSTTRPQKQARRAAVRDQLKRYLSSHPCVDCRNADWRVLEFDHVRGTKTSDISRMVGSGAGWATIEREIEKCEVRCANCHRLVTYERGGGRTGT